MISTVILAGLASLLIGEAAAQSAEALSDWRQGEASFYGELHTPATFRLRRQTLQNVSLNCYPWTTAQVVSWARLRHPLLAPSSVPVGKSVVDKLARSLPTAKLKRCLFCSVVSNSRIDGCRYGVIPQSTFPYWSVGALSTSNLFFEEGPVQGCGCALYGCASCATRSEGSRLVAFTKLGPNWSGKLSHSCSAAAAAILYTRTAGLQVRPDGQSHHPVARTVEQDHSLYLISRGKVAPGTPGETLHVLGKLRLAQPLSPSVPKYLSSTRG